MVPYGHVEEVGYPQSEEARMAYIHPQSEAEEEGRMRTKRHSWGATPPHHWAGTAWLPSRSDCVS